MAEGEDVMKQTEGISRWQIYGRLLPKLVRLRLRCRCSDTCTAHIHTHIRDARTVKQKKREDEKRWRLDGW